MDVRSLVFVYRTDANPVSIVSEFVRESFADDAFECSLCHLTYNTVLKKPEWKRFIRDLPIPSAFVLRSRFVRRHPELQRRTYPAVFLEDTAGSLHDFLDADELRACATVEELMDRVEERLAQVLTPPRPASS